MNNVPLKDLSIKISSGLTPLRSNLEFWDSQDIPWVKTEQLGVKHIYDSNEKISNAALEQTSLKLNPINSISVAMYGEGRTRGRVSILKKEMTTNQACCNIVINEEKASYEYIYYFLKTQYQELRNLSSGVRKNLNSNDIKNFEIRLPQNKKEQVKIACVLSALDEKIELNNKINAELEAMAKLIYDYWFVQFDFLDTNGKPYKSSDGKMVYNQELKREIPDGWSSGTLSDISELVRGVTYGKDDMGNKDDKGVLPILRATNISGNKIDLDNMIYVPEDFVSKKQVLNKYDVLMTMSSGSKNHIGKNSFFYFDEKVSFGAFCAKLVPNKAFQYYLYSYTQSDFMFSSIRNESLGTNINNLNSSLVNGFKIVCPDKTILEKYNIKVCALYEKIGNNQKENRKLTETRDWLSPMLMNGQVTVK